MRVKAQSSFYNPQPVGHSHSITQNKLLNRNLIESFRLDKTFKIVEPNRKSQGCSFTCSGHGRGILLQPLLEFWAPLLCPEIVLLPREEKTTAPILLLFTLSCPQQKNRGSAGQPSLCASMTAISTRS